uniref:Immune mapped protein 2 N-terminal domain-containing protein n=1 Tax=Lotharella globosa TaxID=91324 RepID=A0A6V3MJ64_9EUKA|mmetsp:Transcript_1247/g.2367  ORF Transcript_1247/g.2367 Transcript_1247/m.2367 type:complete len:245 (-) Transcript_1247:186-920(-)|eukprot:CAMPEP_0167782214 /NCGR_PEP_ID=MMETSP0111_2-20121227/6388_1 /TAXON_ID=91324 /ORGANISM="Lotharella globosa, Strain CCCM811" /LENGTH=244 /DNA_ID=CAMNT_0007673011 /DNA_START=107 /DNA_END=841 /DNA_ORIENTATION=-
MGANCYPVKKHADDDHDYGLGKSKKKQKKQHGEEEEHDHHNPHPYSHYYPTSGSTLRLTKKFSSLAGETSTAKTSVEDTIRAKSLGFEPGCYMTFNPGNLGVLFQQWAFRSTDFKDDEIWAYFQPGRQVPRYKFNTHNGKSELLRGMSQVSQMKKKYIGYTHFVKLAIEFGGRLILLRDDIECYYLNGGEVHRMEKDCFYDLSIIKADVVAVIPKDAGTFQGIKTLPGDAFRDNANRVGAALSF